MSPWWECVKSTVCAAGHEQHRGCEGAVRRLYTEQSMTEQACHSSPLLLDNLCTPEVGQQDLRRKIKLVWRHNMSHIWSQGSEKPEACTAKHHLHYQAPSSCLTRGDAWHRLKYCQLREHCCMPGHTEGGSLPSAEWVPAARCICQ